jgi:hypothetical protein
MNKNHSKQQTYRAMKLIKSYDENKSWKNKIFGPIWKNKTLDQSADK